METELEATQNAMALAADVRARRAEAALTAAHAELTAMRTRLEQQTAALNGTQEKHRQELAGVQTLVDSLRSALQESCDARERAEAELAVIRSTMNSSAATSLPNTLSPGATANTAARYHSRLAPTEIHEAKYESLQRQLAEARHEVEVLEAARKTALADATTRDARADNELQRMRTAHLALESKTAAALSELSATRETLAAHGAPSG
jgi:hypothetical protein